MIRSQTFRKHGDSAPPAIPGTLLAAVEKVSTFRENRSGILRRLSSRANCCLRAKIKGTPKAVQPIWYHTPVSATKRKKLIDQSSSHSKTCAPQLGADHVSAMS